MPQPQPQHSNDIWAPDVRLKGFVSQLVPPSVNGEGCNNVASEFARFRAMKSLRSKYARLVTEKGGGKAPPPLAFDRWIARSALSRATAGDGGDHENETGGPTSREPLLPAAEGTDPGLVSDLGRTYPQAVAVVIADLLSASSRLAAAKHGAAFDRAEGGAPDDGAAKSLSRAVKRAVKRARKSTAEGGGGAQPWLDLERAAEALRDHAALAAAALQPPGPPTRVETTSSRSGDIVLMSALDQDGERMKPYMSINKQHYDKLVELHIRFSEQKGGDVNSLIFCLLCRYEALKGVGSQCAVPGAAFDCLAPYLGNTIECFASPLNCRFERYYSAYPELENAFGSLGSFFGDGVLDIQEGSFEANPPFVPEIMTFMEQRINRLLSDSTKGPLSFLIIVPDWGGGGSTSDVLSRSKFKRAETRIAATDHVFADGAQHRASARWRPSSWDTAVILLQNDKGREKWALKTDGLTAAIAKAFTRAANGGATDAGPENVYAWEARGSRKGGRQGNNVPVKRGDGHHNKRSRMD